MGKIKEDLKMGNLVKSNDSTVSKFPLLFDDFFTRDWLSKPYNANISKSVPAVNIKETASAFELEVAAPGLAREDFVLELLNDSLVVSATKKELQKEEGDKYTRKEFAYQSFKRTFTLDRKLVDSEKISANYKDGILYVQVPKAEEAKVKPARQIEIK